VISLREAHKLQVFENKVLRKIFGPMKDEVSREYRILHNEVFELCRSPNIVE
jgi:hypothetical protein